MWRAGAAWPDMACHIGMLSALDWCQHRSGQDLSKVSALWARPSCRHHDAMVGSSGGASAIMLLVLYN